MQGATSVDAIPLFVSPNQINAIMPSTAIPGLASVRVSFNNIPSNPSTPVNVVPSSFGIFTVNGAGNGPGVLMNFVLRTISP